jgi:hypothetical protein
MKLIISQKQTITLPGNYEAVWIGANVCPAN